MVSTAGSERMEAGPCSDVLRPGAKAGPWQIERELGRGGMGAVYAVVHDEIGKRAALKVVHKRLLVPGFNCERMLLEARVVNQVGHPNIVDIFETGKLADGRPYIVMERLEGQPLSARADEGKLLPDLVIAILTQICDALIAAHAAGVVHRDLKLDNVFLVENPEDPATPKAKLLDWGIAKVMSCDVKHTIEGQLVGTPQYLSPEQARGLAVSPQTDVYSLGVMAYELFLEHLPFEAETAAEVMAMHLRLAPPPPHELWPDVPPQLDELLLAMLAKLPEHRPTMREVARRLELVRVELERRRNTRKSSRHPTVTPAESRASRVISSAGLAATEAAPWQTGTKRWQYAIGASALVASAMLFWISRIGDRTADAATTRISAGAVVEASRKSVHAESPSPGAAHPAPRAAALEVPSPTEIDAAAAPEKIPLRGIVERASTTLVTVEPLPAARLAPARQQPRARATSRPIQAHSSPVAPRRGAKVDPDGTLDAYR